MRQTAYWAPSHLASWPDLIESVGGEGAKRPCACETSNSRSCDLRDTCQIWTGDGSSSRETTRSANRPSHIGSPGYESSLYGGLPYGIPLSRIAVHSKACAQCGQSSTEVSQLAAAAYVPQVRHPLMPGKE